MNKMFSTYVQYTSLTVGDLTLHVDSLVYDCSIHILIKSFLSGLHYFTAGPRVHIYFHPDSEDFTMFPALQAAHREGPDPEGTSQCSECRRCAAEWRGGGDCG